VESRPQHQCRPSIISLVMPKTGHARTLIVSGETAHGLRRPSFWMTAQTKPGTRAMVRELVNAVLATIAVVSGMPARGDDSHHGSMQDHLGTVHFVTSCDPAVQPRFDHAMAWLHSFWAKEAIADFTAVRKQDPACAIASWGIAMALQQNPLTGQAPDGATTAQAIAALDKAKAIGAKTQRERDYLAAVDLLYRDSQQDFRVRRQAYAKAMETLASRYPGDTEAKIFYALALEMTAPPADSAYTNQLKAAAILQKLLPQEPDHPGIAHYLVHAYDYPALAKQGLAAARLYARIAPNHPHALHMPSHIFTRLGMWQESIDTNVRSVAAAKADGNGQEQAHAMDYLVYAYLQLGEDEAAKHVADESAVLDVNPANFIGPYAIAAMPARYAIERRVWKEAILLQPRPSRFQFTEAITYFARGLGFAVLMQNAAAEKEETRLAQARDALAARNNTYWSKQVEARRLAVAAWIALSEGQHDHAIALMRASADLEDSMEKHIVTPGPVVPARELFGEMLLNLHQPAAALAAFEASAQRGPNRLMGLYDMAKAAETAGDRERAADCYGRLATLSRATAAARPELLEAKAYSGRN
jgi:hypothetical protein